MDFTKVDDDGSSEPDSNLDEDIDEDMQSNASEDPNKADSENEDSNDDEDDDSDDDENEANTVAEINRLQDELSHNPYDYDKHILLINKLKSLGELDFLREAREKMNKIYPLSPELWLEWIDDETSIATTKDQQMDVLSLYKRAVNEYFSSKLWLNYCQFAIGKMDTLGIDGVREVIELALVHAGLSVVDGTLVWGICRDFEVTILSTFGEINNDNTEQIRTQVKRILKTFRRQLSIPLYEMEQANKELDEWCDSVKELYKIDVKEEYKTQFDNIKQEYPKSLKILESLKEHEQNLLSSDPPHYAEYIKYLDFEIEHDNNLARVQCLFERAITENCLQSDLWLKYLKYCDGKIVVDTILVPIYERSVRNCPWVVDIWVRYIEALERLGQRDGIDGEETSAKICLVLEQALKQSFNSVDDYKKLWLSYLYFVRRKTTAANSWSVEKEQTLVRETFENAINSIESVSSVEYCYDLYKYFAKIEAKYLKNYENGKKLWSKLVENCFTLKRQANFWIDYANFELMFGNEKEYKKILLKGLYQCNDYPEAIGDVLVRFEQEDGTSIEQWDSAVSKYENVMKKINEKRGKENGKSSDSNKNSKRTGKSEDKTSNSTKENLKRKADGHNSSSSKGDSESPKKKKKLDDISQNDNSSMKHGVTVKTDESKREQTVFLSNLDFAVDEAEIRDVFLQFGPINEVRLVRNYKGLSKGYCYVEFEDMMSVRKAILHDRMLLRGRPVFISEMEKRNKFTYSTSKERNKLFVKNIPFDVTKEQLLEKVFPNYIDSIVDVRLVTYRNGHSKGWAYVEMKDEASAQKALEEKNNFEIGDRQLVIAISDPGLVKTGGKPNFDIHAKRTPSINTSSSSKSATFMVPHSLRVKAQPSKVKLQLQNSSSTTDTKTNGNSGGDSKRLNNDQFRSMFLKQ